MKNTSIALGCFDGLHIGHQSVIAPTIDNEHESCVFSFSDDVSSKSNAKHLMTFEDKCVLLEKMGVNSLVIPKFESVCRLSPQEFFKEILIKKLGAKLIICGENYRFGRYAAGTSKLMQSLCAEHGIECKVISPVMLDGEPVSSSRIRQKLIEGNAADAEKMLGRPLSYNFEVVSGRMLGRTLGTPTINQYFPDSFIIPKYGVYASVSKIDGKYYHSVTNIGVKPTVGSEMPLSETWIPDFSGNLYGRHIRVCIIEFMRGEQKFCSIEELKSAILNDGEQSRALTKKHTQEVELNGF